MPHKSVAASAGGAPPRAKGSCWAAQWVGEASSRLCASQNVHKPLKKRPSGCCTPQFPAALSLP